MIHPQPQPTPLTAPTHPPLSQPPTGPSSVESSQSVALGQTPGSPLPSTPAGHLGSSNQANPKQKVMSIDRSKNLVANQQQTQSSPNTSYANTLKKKTSFETANVPNKDQCILFDLTENNVPYVQQFMEGVGDLVEPRNVIFANKMSNNRVGIYLSTKEIVDTFMKDHGGITINGQFFLARRLVNPAFKLCISNASPYIPHEIIEEELKNLGLQLISPISFMRFGMKEGPYQHVLSSRRQAIVKYEENTEFPHSTIIRYDSDPHRIFLSSDDFKCTVCRSPGHPASRCPEKCIQKRLERLTVTCKNTFPPEENSTTTDNNNAIPDQGTSTPLVDSNNTAETGKIIKNPSLDITNQIINNDPPKEAEPTFSKKKRAVSPPQDSTNLLKTNQNEDKKSKSKKPKTAKKSALSSESEDELLTELGKALECELEKSPYHLDASEVLALLEEVKGKHKPTLILSKYTNDFNGLAALFSNTALNHPLPPNTKQTLLRLHHILQTPTNSKVSPSGAKK